LAHAVTRGIALLKKLLFGLVVIAAAGYAIFVVTEEAAPRPVNDRFVVIGTAGETGVYYPVGQAICGLLNSGRAEHGMRCSARATAGSFYNIEALRRGEVEYAIVQSDWQHYAVRGAGAPQPMLVFPALRAMLSLHGEVLSIVVRRDARIVLLEDLQGKRVNLGLPGSGQRESIRLLFEAMGQEIERLVIATQFSPEEQARALCEGSVDALVYLAGHPNTAIGAALEACDTTILPIDGTLVERFVRQNPYYAAATVPANTYPNQRRPIRSVGLLATLVTTTRESEENVYQMARAIYEGFDKLKTVHPALTELDKVETTKAGLTAPLHRGAERYLRAAGMMPQSAER
jgi:TRAP transporter TAXI family solute receptor